MSYLTNLYKTYDYVMDSGKSTGEIPLIPICIGSQNSQITVVIDENSRFLSASVIPKKESSTLIPTTIKSSSRTSKPTPHPLFDNLYYVARDLEPKIESFKKSPYEDYYLPYIKQLEDWKNYKNNEYLNILYKYLTEGNLASDLIKEGILTVDDNGYLIKEKIEGTNQEKAFVRFAIETSEGLVNLWEDDEFLESYSEYYINKLNKEDKDLCYISGKNSYISDIHGKYIRYSGDGTKLISSNDKFGFTFRGRFDDPKEAAQISYEVSEKAHAALRWLIRKQGYVTDGLVILAWTNKDGEIPQPMDDTFNFLLEDEFSSQEINTGEELARRLNSTINGYMKDLDPNERVNIISLDGATPGRLAVLYYSEQTLEDYLSRLKYWHETAAWTTTKWTKDKKPYKYVGAPSPRDIVTFAFGTQKGDFFKLKDEMLKFHLKRLLPCIIDKKRIPIDFVTQLTYTASSPNGKSKYNWRKSLDIACGIIRKFYIERKGVDYKMALNKNETDRSYLYGRLLAVADSIEETYNYRKKTNRTTTNASRMMEAYSKRPARTWKIIYERLTPYIQGLPGGLAYFYKNQINEILDKFDSDEFNSNKSLSPNYLLGFTHQKMYKKEEEIKELEEKDA